MKQTLESALRPINAQAKLEKEEAKVNSDPKAKAELTFHDKERLKMAADPDNQAHVGAIALGKARAKVFLDSAMNMHDKEHKTNFEAFKSLYAMDPKSCEEDHIAQACDELNAHEFEKKDPGYEQNLKRKYQPMGDVTPTKMKMFDNFCSALDEKWTRVGYKNDAHFVKNFTTNYCLTPNDQLMDLKEFQPKK